MYVDDKEKRQHRREDLMLKVQYPDQEDFLHDCTENISRGGTFIFSEKDWAIGDRIKIILSFPGLLQPVELMAEVTWKRKDSVKGIGVKFLFDEYPEIKARLERLVEAVQQKEPAVLARKYRILVAEDNPFIQKLLKEGIEGYSSKKFLDSVMFVFLQAKSGYEGLNIMEEEKIDLVICDLYLPILDGFEMIKRIKSRYPHIPIIAVSAGDEESGRQAIKLGADIFLFKPLVLSRLFGTICSLLKLKPEK
jgi:uncharacterized protein (TIGR02266 family)